MGPGLGRIGSRAAAKAKESATQTGQELGAPAPRSLRELEGAGDVAGPDADDAASPIPQPDDLPIILDPGMAFGTGLHPSTQLCLLATEVVIRPGQRVLDAGCGSGILSIAAARLGAAEIQAFDIDPIAVQASAANAALNDLPVPIHTFISSGPGDGPFWSQPA